MRAEAAVKPDPVMLSDSAARGPTLLALARETIAARWSPAPASPSTPAPRAGWLAAPGATFVTLMQDGTLRGCVGTIDPYLPLAHDVAKNARGAAFGDRRFPPLLEFEFAGTSIEVSLLSDREALAFADEEDALAQLRVGIDGIYLEFGAHRSTFLPQVWEHLPEPAMFLGELKRKAGLPVGFRHPRLRLSRYTVTKFREEDLSAAATPRGPSGVRA